MSTFQLTNKVTLGETSNYGPCLTTFNGSLALAWFGTDGQFNIISSTDGITWGNKKTVVLKAGKNDNVGPPALGSGGGLPSFSQHIGWRNSSDNALWLGLNDPETVGGGVESGEYTDHAPALSSSFIAWTGSGNPQLNVAVCGGANFSGPIVSKVVSPESSDSGPCLCDFNGETLIGWRGSGNYVLNVAQVSGGHIVNKKILGESSDYGPALAGVGSNLYIAWKGSGNPQLNIMHSPNGYASFGGKTVFSDSSDSAPALASHNNALFLAWRGSGNNNLNVARVTGTGL